MAKYLFLKHYRGAPAPENDVPMDQWAPEEMEAHFRYMSDFASPPPAATGEFVDSQALSPDGLWVRSDGEGRPPVTDGPFAETKDLIAGWMVIDVDSRERASSSPPSCPLLRGRVAGRSTSGSRSARSSPTHRPSPTDRGRGRPPRARPAGPERSSSVGVPTSSRPRTPCRRPSSDRWRRGSVSCPPIPRAGSSPWRGGSSSTRRDRSRLVAIVRSGSASSRRPASPRARRHAAAVLPVRPSRISRRRRRVALTLRAVGGFDHPPDRAGVPRAGDHDGPADQSGQAHRRSSRRRSSRDVPTVMRVLYLVFNEGYSGDVDLAARRPSDSRANSGRRRTTPRSTGCSR